MISKNILVCFLAIVSIFASLAVVNAAQIADVDMVQIDGIYDDYTVIAGETVPVKIWFEALEDASDVRIRAELEGDKKDVSVKIGPFDLEEGQGYNKKLTLEIPYEYTDEVSYDATLTLKIWNGEHETEEEFDVRIQRPSYNADVMSISVPQRVDAGETLATDIVLKNIGYNELEDLYVTAKIPELDLERTVYFGDLASYECDNDEDNYCNSNDDDTISKRIYLQIPYEAQEGIYTIEVEVKNDDLTSTEVKQIAIENDFSAGNIMATLYQKSVAVGEDAEFNLLVANPTNKLKVYKIVPESTPNAYVSVEQSLVAVPAGSSKYVAITANIISEGEHKFNVNVFSGDELVNTVTLGASASGTSIDNPIVILTIVLAVIFLVLLVVLIVLLGKKPTKAEDFGESYY